VIDWADSESAERVILAVRRGNRRAVALYERAGFVSAGPNPDDPSEDTMERVLDAADVATV
jgi:RimJ/RimL family protein N-acetyltransferase